MVGYVKRASTVCSRLVPKMGNVRSGAGGEGLEMIARCFVCLWEVMGGLGEVGGVQGGVVDGWRRR